MTHHYLPYPVHNNDQHKFASHHPSQESDWGFQEISHHDKVPRQDQEVKICEQSSVLPQPKFLSPDNKERGSVLVRSLYY